MSPPPPPYPATVISEPVPLDTRAQAIKMLAKNALALRRATPVGHRCMSALVTNVDQLAAQASKMEKTLPDMLKPLATGMVRLSHSLPPCTRERALQHTQAPEALASAHRKNGACRAC